MEQEPRTPNEILPPEEERAEPERALVPRLEMVTPQFRYQVVTTLTEMKEIFQAHRQLLREVMEPGIDFGPIPGTTTDRTLFKAGAEKLQILHGYAHEMHLVNEVLEWDPPFFHYRYRCDILDRRTGSLVGQAYGSCNSAESKYAYRWVTKSKIPADLDLRLVPQRKKRRGTRDWTVYRIPNPDIPDLVNTIDKMAQKRAFVGAVRICTGASGLFAEEAMAPGDGERGKPAPAVEEVEEETPEELKQEPKEEAKRKGKRAPDGKLDTKVKLLYNKANAMLQEEGLAAYFTTSEHVKNTLHAEGLKDKQILGTSEKSLINLLIKHAKEASK